MIYTNKVNEVPSVCCEGHPVDRLVSICLLVPCSKDQTPIHRTVPDARVESVAKDWVLACGKEKLPPQFTDQPSACTCQKCREYAEKIYSEGGLSLDMEEDLQNTHIQVEFEDDSPPPNPFK
jgi:hypothetical protein